jgi:hypothetical protein
VTRWWWGGNGRSEARPTGVPDDNVLEQVRVASIHGDGGGDGTRRKTPPSTRLVKPVGSASRSTPKPHVERSFRPMPPACPASLSLSFSSPFSLSHTHPLPALHRLPGVRMDDAQQHKNNARARDFCCWGGKAAQPPRARRGFTLCQNCPAPHARAKDQAGARGERGEEKPSGWLPSVLVPCGDKMISLHKEQKTQSP